MELQTRKIQFIQDILRLKNEKILQKLEKILRLEKEKLFKNDFVQMTMSEYNSLIDSAENDSENNRLFNAEEILKDIDTWQ